MSSPREELATMGRGCLSHKLVVLGVTCVIDSVLDSVYKAKQ